MQLLRFHLPRLGARIGQLVASQVYDLTASGRPAFATLAAALQASVTTPIRELLEDLDLSHLPAYAFADLDRAPAEGFRHLLPPVDRQEVWAAGVTYAWSREARVREAQAKDVYVKVYEAERPELFFKCLGEKAVGPNDWVGLRGDSHWNVPEPELTLVLNPALQIVGYTVGNDVSSRDMEGENPLYLPQAKIYRHSCALGPVITLAEDDLGVPSLDIELTIIRDAASVVQGETSTAKINRDLTELAAYLGRYNDFPCGAVLMTGTGIVPPDDFTLQHGDEVLIQVESIGTLRNVVRQM
jgi:2-dehydro-3-deoxy-D-arabinonate dehydratase